MKAKTQTQPRFDLDTLREIAGDKVFARGEQYHRSGQVEILSIDPQRVLAQVAGTEDYRTALTGRGKRLTGECSCPAAEDWGFCKHMVAVALVANDMGSDAETAGVGALGRIREHLKQSGTDALVEMIIQLAERDPALLRKLDVAAMTVKADDTTIEQRLRAAIDRATRTSGCVDYHAAAGWADGVETTLDAIADLASGERASLAMQMAERTIDRIERAIGQIDDSDGYCNALLNRAAEIHLAAAQVARPEPIALARNLFARETQGEYDTFAAAAELYADVLGGPGLAEYRRLADAAWAKLPARTDKDQARSDRADNYDSLCQILDFFAERDGDVQARIDLRAKDLSSPWNYLQLAQFCAAQDREDAALRWAEEGLFVFADAKPDERLVSFAADLLQKAGRHTEATAHVWRVFEQAPSLELYGRLRRLGGDLAARRAVELLQARLVGPTAQRWRNPADLLISILTQEGRFDAAWAAIRAHGASDGIKEALAQASEATHPQAAVKVYVEKVEQLALGGGNPAYEKAAKLIARMATLRSAPEHATHVAEFKQRHSRKRNLIKLLG